MFISLVHLHCTGACLVAPTENEYFLSCRFWMRMLEGSLLSFWKRGFKPLIERPLYNVSYALTIDRPSQFFFAYIRMAFLSYSCITMVYLLPLKYVNGYFPIRSEYFPLLIQWRRPLFHLFYHEWWLIFHPRGCIALLISLLLLLLMQVIL